MKTCIYYATRSGNTRQAAEAIAAALLAQGPVSIHELGVDPPDIPADVDLLLVGGPTEGRHPTPPVTAFLDGIEPDAVRGLAAAAFDTRLDWPRWLSGSAAVDIGRRLQALGARLVAPPETFLVSTKPELLSGELQRAGRWAASLAAPHIDRGRSIRPEPADHPSLYPRSHRGGIRPLQQPARRRAEGRHSAVSVRSPSVVVDGIVASQRHG